MVTNDTGNTISVFTPTGSANADYTASGNLSSPTAVAFDAPGKLWIANSTATSLTELNSRGTFVSQITSGIRRPTAVVIDPT